MPDVHPLTIFRQRHDPPLSKTALAEMLGVSRITIWRWEAGTRRPGLQQIPSIAGKTGIPARELRPDLAKAMGAAGWP